MRESVPKLKIALLLNSLSQPAWTARIIEEISDSRFAEICLVVLLDSGKNGAPPSGKLGLNAGGLLWKAYSALDDRSMHPYPDPFEPAKTLAALETLPIITVCPVQNGRDDYLADHEVSAIRSYSPDVVLDFARENLKGSAIGMARYGVWKCSPLGNLQNGGAAQEFWALRDDVPIVDFSLRVRGHRSREKLLYHSFTAADLCSVKGTRSKVYWKSARAVLRCLRHLHQRGPAYLEDGRFRQDYSEHAPPACSVPTSRDMVAFLIEIARRRLGRKFRNWWSKESWCLAYRIGEPCFWDKFEDFTYMKPPNDRFWADPFPLKRGDKYYIFIEEFVYARMKGHISVIEMEPDGTWSPPVKVLETNYHLSYPYLLEWNGQLYMIPESKRNKTIELYRCSEFPTRWHLEKILVKDIEAVDSTIFEHSGMWWLFCNVGGKEFSSNDELHAFSAKTPLGPWSPHPENPIKSDAGSSRPAGRPFRWKGSLFRPSQDCLLRMGGAMVINRVQELTQESYREEEVARIEPSWFERSYGTHTFNFSEELTVVDCFGYVSKFS